MLTSRNVGSASGAASDSQPNNGGYRRIWVGRTADDAATLALMDAAGKKRIMLKVAANGGAKMEFLDNEGNVIKVIRGDDPAPAKE
ncbi:MAG: hypothetical protein M3Y93_12240 [Pseudomonadota bacterium]|nr:hypothetical protein [Pseudomonadota bacterium]